MCSIAGVMRMTCKLTQEYLRERLDYDPETGVFTWKRSSLMNASWNGKFAGKPAGGIRPDGYSRIVLDNKLHLSHRLAWVWMLGGAAPEVIDHADRDNKNNTWSNLRAATKSQNAVNSGLPVTNTTGVKGVYRTPRGMWVAEYWKDGKKIRVGTFTTIDAARVNREAAVADAFGEFAMAS